MLRRIGRRSEDRNLLLAVDDSIFERRMALTQLLQPM